MAASPLPSWGPKRGRKCYVTSAWAFLEVGWRTAGTLTLQALWCRFHSPPHARISGFAESTAKSSLTRIHQHWMQVAHTCGEVPRWNVLPGMTFGLTHMQKVVLRN